MDRIKGVLAAIAVVLGFAVAIAAQAADRPDSWVTLKTKIALLTTEGVDSSDLTVDTSNGLVTLHGTVATDAARVAAENVAGGIEGVTSVKNLLQVVPRSDGDVARDKDDLIKWDVQKMLDADPTLRGIYILSVDRGVVLLSGQVDSLANHLRAIEVVSRIQGVRRVSTKVTTKNDTE
jgi:hyperosmotically inducible protein